MLLGASLWSCSVFLITKEVVEVARYRAGVKCSGGFRWSFPRTADQLFKDDAHAEVLLMNSGSQWCDGETLHYLITAVACFQRLHEVFKVEVFEKILAGVLADACTYLHQVGGGLGVGQGAESQRRTI